MPLQRALQRTLQQTGKGSLLPDNGVSGGTPDPGPEIPNYAVVNRDGSYVLNRDGAYLVADPTPRTS